MRRSSMGSGEDPADAESVIYDYPLGTERQRGWNSQFIRTEVWVPT